MKTKGENRMNRREFVQAAGGAMAGATAFLSHTAEKAFAAKSSKGKPMARTVLGDIPPEELGMTLVHMHLPVDWSELYTPGVFPPLEGEKREEAIRLFSTAFNDYCDNYLGPYGGKGTVVDCTPIRLGRFPLVYRDIAKASKLHVITMTGFWGENYCPMHIEGARFATQPNGIEKMAKFFVKEIIEGIEDPYYPFGTRFTDVKAGIMKACTSQYMTPLEEATHRGCALACLETGCPITTHTADGGGMEEADLFLSMGVPPNKIAIGHLGHTDDRKNEVALDYITAIADKGCYVEFDRHRKPYSIENYVKLVTHLKKRGHIDRILFGFDMIPYSYKGRNEKNKTPDLWTATMDGFDFPLVVRDIKPALLQAGITENEVTQMFVENPKRYLAF